MSRLTKKIDNPEYSNDYVMLCAHEYHILNKLGKLEDLFDIYSIETLADLNVILAEYFCEVKDHTFKLKDEEE